jgi:type I restriction enzyme S subunit
MKDDSQLILAPKLRFPEFRDAPAWKERTIGSYLTESHVVGSNGHLAKKLTVKLWGNGVTAKTEVLRGSENTQYYRRQAGQFIYSKLDFLNRAFGVIPPNLDGYESTVDLPCFDIADSLNGKFLLEYVQRECFYKKHGELADGGRKAKRIQVEPFLAFPIAVPEQVAEQQKIADCLTSLDELIAAHGRKLEALRTHKKGLMQQLFPREGETRPRLRFPEFREMRDWTVKPLSECFTHIRNGFVGTATPYYVRDGVPYLQGKNIKDSRIDPTGLVRISRTFHQKQTKSQLSSNDILMVQSGHVGECALVGADYDGGNCHALIVMTPDKSQHAPFFVQYFYSPHGKGKIAKITTGNTIEHILASDLKVLETIMPEYEEQQVIAAFLESLDALIVAQSQKLAALQMHKKGLIQQLFPSPEVA